jgi:NADH-quinone oxidoreductase subunit A
MLIDYLPVLLHIIVAVGFATVALLANLVIGRTGTRSANKDASYECGILPEPGPQPRFSVKFYLVAMLFILFDIEVVFMYPWAVVFRDFVAAPAGGTGILWSMLSFVVLLLFGYAYAIRKGALSWKG